MERISTCWLALACKLDKLLCIHHNFITELRQPNGDLAQATGGLGVESEEVDGVETTEDSILKSFNFLCFTPLWIFRPF